ncbi:3-methyl-2-oxobutanoate hydroxymethyltransferase [Dasania sp. GY-MA-18]|uniref:3-methyl-2-oxobutanoate hydroxymethyltransferase n=1 Tax=Dasania phycosphaerae TaxID=2950436 RepID=A0A9J6RQS2_9GAMM|nr:MULTISPECIES: 3-methyl-2-oxobutanoate hydroxymethyltransferase [Dasania]MCR8924371.1 3-methyl-2-oxobutanoate hydroxymethyltransferase [Dasania sp. GY-MA-18]MCZ0867046.1 3-methyl-2-oxobutanoate hydroxymethyltransferase [Dasania phycosphaerae]MCZ0870498.1 3-methyl-2-oxobutanoate hydroxymethyltransferase [Dasania phycosphaerae]
MRAVTINTLQAHKAAGDKFAVITSYDACFAHLVEEAGIEVILVGDSLGMVLQGHNSTLPVTVSDMAYHTANVARGCSKPLIVTDMPFGSYSSSELALANAVALMQAGAHMVKVEGGAWLLSTIKALTERSIPVCGHLGLTPQSVNSLGGYKVQGRDPKQAQTIIDDAKQLEQAGASLLVLECVPADLAKKISQALSIPVIGIGAGADTDAQVLVIHDMLGLSSHTPKFVRNFMAGNNSIQQALSDYHAAVKSGEFPSAEHTFSG